MIDGPLTYRWGLNGRILSVRRDGTGGRKRRWLEIDEAVTLWGKTRDRLSPLFDRVGSEDLPGLQFSEGDPPPSQKDLLDALRNLKGWDVDALQRDAVRFKEIYTPVGILPPDQYMALVIQLTHGCSFNTCTFCTFYRDIPFRVKSPLELRRHLADVDGFLGWGISLRHSLFLGDANALVVPMDNLVPLLEIVKDHYGDRMRGPCEADAGLTGMHAFLDGFSGTRKSVEDYRRLRGLGLKRITVGMESGHDPLLEWLHKPGTSSDMADCVRAMKGAGLQVCLVILIGAGGETFDRGHVRDTQRLLADMPLDSEDIIYFSEYVDEPGAAYGVIMKEEGITPLDGEAVSRQRNEIGSSLPPRDRGGPRRAVYDIREFTY